MKQTWAPGSEILPSLPLIPSVLPLSYPIACEAFPSPPCTPCTQVTSATAMVTPTAPPSDTVLLLSPDSKINLLLPPPRSPRPRVMSLKARTGGQLLASCLPCNRCLGNIYCLVMYTYMWGLDHHVLGGAAWPLRRGSVT